MEYEEEVYAVLTDEEIQRMYEEWEADAWLSSMDSHDMDYIDSGL